MNGILGEIGGGYPVSIVAGEDKVLYQNRA